jgi:hypothetical protein
MKQHGIGRKLWAIAEGYIPTWSHGPSPEMKSHETLCILNANADPTEVRVMVYFSDRDPVGPYKIMVEGRRTLHQRLGELNGPEPIPAGKDYACVIESDLPIVVQHTRLDSRQAENALISTIAYSEGAA